MAYEYYVDGETDVARIDLDDGSEQMFRYRHLDWAPATFSVRAAASVGEYHRTSEADAQRVCELIRAKTAASNAS